MPPAFNLSQDQTLQFNLCFDCNTFLYQSFLKILTRFLLSKSLLSSVNVCFFSFATNKRPRLSSVFFLKIVSLYHLCSSNKAFCLSSAQKRNYEPLFNPCQQLFLFYFFKTPKKQTLKSLPTPHLPHLKTTSVQRRNEIMGLPFPRVKCFSGNFAFVAFLIQINFQSDSEKRCFPKSEKEISLVGNSLKRLKIFGKCFGDTLRVVNSDGRPPFFRTAKGCQ